jgi:hypothetical protein
MPRWRCWLRTNTRRSSLALSSATARRSLVSRTSSWGPGADLGPWPGCLAFAGELFPDKPVVGSESEDSLLQAERNGFRLLGPSAYGSTTAVASKSASEERLQDNWRSWVPGET